MAKQIQFRRGTTEEHQTFVGALGEVTVDTTKDAVVVHDGITTGGFPAARERDLLATNAVLSTLSATVGVIYETVAVLNPGDAAAEQARLRANIVAANLQISTLRSNATTQALSIGSLQNSVSGLTSVQIAHGISIDLITDALSHVTTSQLTGVGDALNELFGNAVAQEEKIISLTAASSAYRYYANANVGTLFLGNISTQANLGAFQVYANANAASMQGQLDSYQGTIITLTNNIIQFEQQVNANVGNISTALSSFRTAANANIGTLFLGNVSTQSNLGAFQIYANANAASLQNQITGANNSAQTFSANLGSFQTWSNNNIISIQNQINNTISANIGAYQLLTNANIGTLVLGNISTQSNLGAYQQWANANIGTLFLGNVSTQSNLGAYQTWANSAITGILNLLGNTPLLLSEFKTYANAKIGSNPNGNLVVPATTSSISATTGALVVAGGAGIAGNLVARGVFIGNGTPTSGLFWNANNVSIIASLQAAVPSLASILQAVYPVGSIYTNANNSTNPATLLGFGTWVVFGAGRVPVGFDNADPLFNGPEKTGGNKDAVVVSHNHTASVSVNDPSHQHYDAYSEAFGGPFGQSPGRGYQGSGRTDNDNFLYKTSPEVTGITVGVSIGTTGSSGVNANYQPFITVYMWKRTA